MSERKETPCVTCLGTGYLPLNERAREAISNREKVSIHNGDWLVCTDCDGTGTFVMYEHLVAPSVPIFLNGLRK